MSTLTGRITGSRSLPLWLAATPRSRCACRRVTKPATIGAIVTEAVRLEYVSEVVVLDDGSTDDTAAIALRPGRVVSEASVLPEPDPGPVNGNAMWKSLYTCHGDIICWVDADLRNFRREYIERLCAPLLASPTPCS